MFDKVLVVCVGNICRSPMAEALLRARLGHRPRFDVSSAGISALVGHPADEQAVALMKERGIDIGPHRARQLTPQLAAGADLILVMESGHERAVYSIAPRPGARSTASAGSATSTCPTRTGSLAPPSWTRCNSWSEASTTTSAPSGRPR
jgi:protein-tyrosine-phosphatase